MELEASDVNSSLLTHQELAAKLKIDVAEVHRRRRLGIFPYLLLGPKVVRYYWPSVLAALQQRETTGPLKASPNPKARRKEGATDGR
jgi:hypothetical protein